MTQSESIIQRFGTAYRLAALIDTAPSVVYRWTYPVERGGTGGHIPAHRHRHIKAAARKAGIRLTAKDWYPEEK